MSIHLSSAYRIAGIVSLAAMAGCTTTRIVEKEVCGSACQEAARRTERLGIVNALNARVSGFEQVGDKANANAMSLVLAHYIRGTDPDLNAQIEASLKQNNLTAAMVQEMAARGKTVDFQVLSVGGPASAASGAATRTIIIRQASPTPSK